jgi:hypothetical protein
VEQLPNIWSTCKRLLIVIPYLDEMNYKEYRSALDKILNSSNVIELKIIVVINESLKKESLQQHKLIGYISRKDVSFFGKIKDGNMLNILAQPYDLMLWFKVADKKIAKVILANHAKWKIGINTPLNIFKVSANSQSDIPSEIVNFAKNTLEKINTL